MVFLAVVVELVLVVFWVAEVEQVHMVGSSVAGVEQVRMVGSSVAEEQDEMVEEGHSLCLV